MVGYIVMMILACNIYSAKGDEQYEATQYVFNAIIPLIASWVGTVLAFFFGRESFEATTK